MGRVVRRAGPARGRVVAEPGVHRQAARRVDVGRVRSAGGAQQRRLRRLLVHRVPPRGRRQGNDPGPQPRTEARTRAGRNHACSARLRRGRLPRLVPVRGAGRAAPDQEPRGLREEPDDRAGLADRMLLRREGAPPPGRRHGGARRSGRAHRGPGRRHGRGISGGRRLGARRLSLQRCPVDLRAARLPPRPQDRQAPLGRDEGRRAGSSRAT